MKVTETKKKQTVFRDFFCSVSFAQSEHSETTTKLLLLVIIIINRQLFVEKLVMINIEM